MLDAKPSRLALVLQNKWDLEPLLVSESGGQLECLNPPLQEVLTKHSTERFKWCFPSSV